MRGAYTQSEGTPILGFPDHIHIGILRVRKQGHLFWFSRLQSADQHIVPPLPPTWAAFRSLIYTKNFKQICFIFISDQLVRIQYSDACCFSMKEKSLTCVEGLDENN